MSVQRERAREGKERDRERRRKEGLRERNSLPRAELFNLPTDYLREDLDPVRVAVKIRACAVKIRACDSKNTCV